MAKDHSFDIVSNVDMQEVDNAIQQTTKEIAQRYDLKGTGASVTLDKGASTVTVAAPDEFIARQVIDVLGTKLIRRSVDLKALSWGTPQRASGDSVRLVASVVSGIETDIARSINKSIRDAKFKVKVAIEGDKLRVSAGKIDDLQEVIAFVKEYDAGIPLQFINYR